MADKEYKRKGYAPDLSETDNIMAVTDILLTTVKAGRPAEYPEENGLERFKKNTIEYLEHVQEINSSDDVSKKVIPDIESWACYLGITRATLATYARTRGDDWKQFIAVVKNGIAAVKKDAAFHQQIAPVMAMFDFTNNHDYVNTNEFKLNASVTEDTRKVLPADAKIDLLAWKSKGNTEDIDSVDTKDNI